MDKKKEVKTTKKVTKVTKKTNKKIDYKKVVTNEKFLLGVFILLAVFVCILGCFVIKEMNSNRVIDKTNVVLPIVEENTNNGLEIDAYGLTKERFYVIKVTNYHEKDINDEEFEYTIDIENDTKATIKVTKKLKITDPDPNPRTIKPFAKPNCKKCSVCPSKTFPLFL